MITNQQSRTRVDEVAAGIFRISTPVTALGGFTFNQYLIDDEQPLLFHTGPRRMFPLVSEAIAAVMPLSRLRYVGLSHFEADECGALNEFLAVASGAEPVCGQIAAMVSVDDVADRKARALTDGESLHLGRHCCAGSTRPTSLTAGSAASFSRSTRARSSAAICSPRAAPSTRPSRNRTSSAPARPCAAAWTTGPTRPTRAVCWSVWPRSLPRPSPACTAPHGTGTARRCCAPSPTASRARWRLRRCQPPQGTRPSVEVRGLRRIEPGGTTLVHARRGHPHRHFDSARGQLGLEEAVAVGDHGEGRVVHEPRLGHVREPPEILHVPADARFGVVARDFVVDQERPVGRLKQQSLPLEGCEERGRDRLAPVLERFQRALGRVHVAPVRNRVVVPPHLKVASASPRAGRQTEHDGSGRGRERLGGCLLYTSPSPRDGLLSRM